MVVTHLELPRHFTFTVKEYLTEVDEELASGGYVFRQYELNPLFWKWVLGLSTPHSPQDSLEPLLSSNKAEDYWRSLADMRAHLIELGKYYGAQFDFYGLRLPQDVLNSAYAMCTLVADNFGSGLFANFFHFIEKRTRFLESDVISLGADYQTGVFWAIALASWVKSSGSKAHVHIARHSYENFSLIHHIEALSHNRWFFSQIDSVAVYEEELPTTMVRLCDFLSGAPQDALENIAIRLGNGVATFPTRPVARTIVREARNTYAIPSEYFDSMDVPRDQLVYAMSMVRNKCFYKKCSFCVQISKHLSDNAYAADSELDRSLAACAELQRHGVTMINFHDEAMRPKDLKAFSSRILADGIDLRWEGRTVAAANPNAEVLKLMREAGCTEILFGLETFDPQLAAQMGKISGTHANTEATRKVIDAYLESGLFITLSMIYGFPTEKPEALELTLDASEELAARSSKLAFIFNKFLLFHTSMAYKEPESFNIGAIEPQIGVNDLQYRFDYARAGGEDYLTEATLGRMHRIKLGLSESAFTENSQKYGPLLDLGYLLDYASFGLRFRAKHDRTLLAHILA